MEDYNKKLDYKSITNIKINNSKIKDIDDELPILNINDLNLNQLELSKQSDDSKSLKQEIKKRIFTSPLPIETRFQDRSLLSIITAKKYYCKKSKGLSRTNWYIFVIIFLLSITITAMSIYSLVVSIEVFVQWNFCLQNGITSGNINNLPFAFNLPSLYFYQYFFNDNGHISVGLSQTMWDEAVKNQISTATASNLQNFANTVSNYSVSGFYWISYYKFINGLGTIPTSDVLQSKLGLQIPYSAIIDIIYSLFGLILVVALANAKLKVKSFTILSIILGILFIIF